MLTFYVVTEVLKKRLIDEVRNTLMFEFFVS